MTHFIFFGGFLFLLGIFIGKFFKKLNPFLMIFGIILFVIFAPLVEGRILYSLCFGTGFLSTWFNPFRFVASILTNIQTSLGLIVSRIGYNMERKSAVSQAEERIRTQAEELRYEREELNREKQRLNEEWERIKKEWEDIRRERERQNWKSGDKKKKDEERKVYKGRYFKEFASFDLDNHSRNDEYAILGVTRETSEKDILKMFRKLSMKYHPDKYQNENSEKLEEARQVFMLLDWARKKIL
jgi:hypothetical protein